MKFAEDFRRIARESLTNKWLIAVLAGLVASLLGGLASEVTKFKINIDISNLSVKFDFAGHTIFSTGTNFDINSDFVTWIVGSFGFIMIAALAMAVIYMILGSFVSVGYANFNINLVDKKEVKFETLFEYFTYWKTTALMRFLKSLYVFLWSFLFIIPGIVAGYSYSMTDYIFAENPNMSAIEAIERSKTIMHGNRFRLFCLQFSFIGWSILAAFSFGIGYLFLTPYKQAAYAAFYREISSTEAVMEE